MLNIGKIFWQLHFTKNTCKVNFSTYCHFPLQLFFVFLEANTEAILWLGKSK